MNESQGLGPIALRQDLLTRDGPPRSLETTGSIIRRPINKIGGGVEQRWRNPRACKEFIAVDRGIRDGRVLRQRRERAAD